MITMEIVGTLDTAMKAGEGECVVMEQTNVDRSVWRQRFKIATIDQRGECIHYVLQPVDGCFGV